MATIFTFPKTPRVGDRVEILSISNEKMPINIVANPEAEKPLELIYPDNVYSSELGGTTAVVQITDVNVLYGFRCVSTKDKHVWLLENDVLLKKKIAQLEARVSALEDAVANNAE